MFSRAFWIVVCLLMLGISAKAWHDKLFLTEPVRVYRIYALMAGPAVLLILLLRRVIGRSVDKDLG